MYDYTTVPEQYSTHHEATAGKSSFHCPKCGVAVRYVIFGHMSGITKYECPSCGACGGSFEELRHEAIRDGGIGLGWLVYAIGETILAHAEHPTEPSKGMRRHDGKTPYGVHPVWCAMTLLHETSLPEQLRRDGAEALLLHDRLEDTTTGVPEGTSAYICSLVEGMTFASIQEEMEGVWEQSPVIWLLKLYDKASNLLDGVWMTPKKREGYLSYTRQLADNVESRYGTLNIIRIIRALV